MKTVSLKLNGEQVSWLDQQAGGQRRSRSAIVRDLIDERRSKRGPASLYARTKDLCGSLRGSKDLSTRPLKRYGRDWHSAR